jgi:hypothetical protein
MAEHLHEALSLNPSTTKKTEKNFKKEQDVTRVPISLSR